MFIPPEHGHYVLFSIFYSQCIVNSSCSLNSCWFKPLTHLCISSPEKWFQTCLKGSFSCHYHFRLKQNHKYIERGCTRRIWDEWVLWIFKSLNTLWVVWPCLCLFNKKKLYLITTWRCWFVFVLTLLLGYWINLTSLHVRVNLMPGGSRVLWPCPSQMQSKLTLFPLSLHHISLLKSHS